MSDKPNKYDIDPDLIQHMSEDQRNAYIEHMVESRNMDNQIRLEELRLKDQELRLQKEQMERAAPEVKQEKMTAMEAMQKYREDRHRERGTLTSEQNHMTGELIISRGGYKWCVSEQEFMMYKQQYSEAEFESICHAKFDDLERADKPTYPSYPKAEKKIEPGTYDVKIDMQGKTPSEWWEGEFGKDRNWPKPTSDEWAKMVTAEHQQKASETAKELLDNMKPNAGPAWDPKKSRKREKDMANKFLPFVVESSTPQHVFKTLISRSKGMNKVLIASIFNLTLNVEIKKLREVVKELPDMTTDKIYEELLTKYPTYRMDDDLIKTYIGMQKYFPAYSSEDEEPWLSEELQQYDAKDVFLFFSVLSQSDIPTHEYTNIDFAPVLDSETIFNDLGTYLHLADKDESAIRVKVNDQEDLRCAVLYYAVIWHQFHGDRNIPTCTFKMKDQS